MSAAEVAMRDSQLDENIKNMQIAIKKIEKDKASETKALAIDEVEQQCKDCDTLLEMIRMEFRSLRPEDKDKYRRKVKDHKQNLKVIRNDLEWLKESSNRKDLLGGAAGGSSVGPDLESADGLMEHGRNLQKESKASLQRTVGIVNDAQQLGRETATKLNQQTEQMKKMYGDLLEIDDMLKRSRKIIGVMLKKTASSKAVWLLVFAVVVGIALIVYVKTR